MLRKAEARGNMGDVQATIDATPVRRMGQPEDIAAACAFFISEEAATSPARSSASTAAATRKPQPAGFVVVGVTEDVTVTVVVLTVVVGLPVVVALDEVPDCEAGFLELDPRILVDHVVARGHQDLGG